MDFKKGDLVKIKPEFREEDELYVYILLEEPDGGRVKIQACIITLTPFTSFKLDDSQRLINVGKNIVDVFDADTQANHLRFYSGPELFFLGELPVRGRGRVAGQRLGITDIHQALDQRQGIIEFHACLEASLDTEGQ